jgi:hypothetical protein
MAKLQLSLANVADAATLSGGLWLGTAPLANLQQKLLSKVARSVDLLATSTRLDIDIGNASTIVRFVAMARHNLTTAATYRITAGTTVGGADIYDSTTLPVWPAVYLPEDLEWEDDNWWEGQISTAEAEGYPIALEHDVGSNIRARYWRIALTDAANPAGYVELARLWMGPLWAPQRNLSYGAGLTWEARSVSEYSLGGVLFSEPRPPARVLRLTLNALNDAEAYGTLLDAQRRVGTDGEVWVIPNWDDAARRFKRDFLARFRRFDPIAHIHNRLHETSFELEERL